MSLQDFSVETVSHNSLMNRMMTGWISTASDLRVALKYMEMQRRPGKSYLYIIRTADCEDIYDAEAVSEALPWIRPVLREPWEKAEYM